MQERTVGGVVGMRHVECDHVAMAYKKVSDLQILKPMRQGYNVLIDKLCLVTTTYGQWFLAVQHHCKKDQRDQQEGWHHF